MERTVKMLTGVVRRSRHAAAATSLKASTNPRFGVPNPGLPWFSPFANREADSNRDRTEEHLTEGILSTSLAVARSERVLRQR